MQGGGSLRAHRRAGGVDMIKVVFKTPKGAYWAECERVEYVRGGGYVLENVARDSGSCRPWQWAKTPENWKIVQIGPV